MSVDDQFDRLTDLLIHCDEKGIALKVLRLHRPYGASWDRPRCNGCDGEGGETDPAWPCSTVKLLARAIGYERVIEEDVS